MRHGAEMDYLRSLYKERGLSDEEINELYRKAHKKAFVTAAIVMLLTGLGIFIFHVR